MRAREAPCQHWRARHGHARGAGPARGALAPSCFGMDDDA